MEYTIKYFSVITLDCTSLFPSNACNLASVSQFETKTPDFVDIKAYHKLCPSQTSPGKKLHTHRLTAQSSVMLLYHLGVYMHTVVL
jgi:hypothetical protein